MKSFLIAATIALVGSSLIVDTASARSKRSAKMGGMASMATMAPALAAGVGLIGAGGFIGGGPIVTPYVGGPIDTFGGPVITPHVYVPVMTPFVPTGFGLPGTSMLDIGG